MESYFLSDGIFIAQRFGVNGRRDVDSAWEQRKNSKPSFAKCLTRSVRTPQSGSFQRPMHIILVLVQDAVLGGFELAKMITGRDRANIQCLL
jgi:hypothetical protein